MAARVGRLKEDGKTIYKATTDAGIVNTVAAEALKAGSGGGLGVFFSYS